LIRLLSKITLAVALLAAGLFHGEQALATCAASYPFTFVNGVSIVDASTLMSNLNDVRSCATTVDNTQIGTLGIYASQIIPTTVPQATFGGAFGYTFFPNQAAQVPVTIKLATGQTANALTIVTNAGIVIAWVTSGGALNVGNTAQASTGGDAAFSRSVQTGSITLGGVTDSATLDFGVTSPNEITLKKPNGGGNLHLGDGITGDGKLFISSSSNILASSSDVVATIIGNLASFRNGATGEVTIDNSGHIGVNTLSQVSNRKKKRGVQFFNLADNPFTGWARKTTIVRYCLQVESPTECTPGGKGSHFSIDATTAPSEFSGPFHNYMEPGGVASWALGLGKELDRRVSAAEGVLTSLIFQVRVLEVVVGLLLLERVVSAARRHIS
jgi:hypothetical protein